MYADTYEELVFKLQNRYTTEIVKIILSAPVYADKFMLDRFAVIYINKDIIGKYHTDISPREDNTYKFFRLYGDAPFKINGEYRVTPNMFSLIGPIEY